MGVTAVSAPAAGSAEVWAPAAALVPAAAAAVHVAAAAAAVATLLGSERAVEEEEEELASASSTAATSTGPRSCQQAGYDGSTALASPTRQGVRGHITATCRRAVTHRSWHYRP